jgi:DNA repair exonuclease SbcCD nuclease subunit
VILTADWHLTDNPADEYRWDVFDRLHEIIDLTGHKHIVILGDITDRKDKHSARLVNRLISKLEDLCYDNGQVTILMGNHDMPLNGPPFWQMLTALEAKISFHTEPCHIEDILFLPYTHEPGLAWSKLNWNNLRVVFMHQTVTGAKVGHHALTDHRGVPEFPASVRVYSGDIHTPQTVRGVTYVGAPHPIKFGDDYECRILTLDQNYNVDDEFILDPPRKQILTVRSLTELQRQPVKPGDQLRIRCTPTSGSAEQWLLDQEKLAAWVRERGATVVSVEVDLLTPDSSVAEFTGGDDPYSVLTRWAASETIGEDLRITGQSLLDEELRESR